MARPTIFWQRWNAGIEKRTCRLGERNVLSLGNYYHLEITTLMRLTPFFGSEELVADHVILL